MGRGGDWDGEWRRGVERGMKETGGCREIGMECKREREKRVEGDGDWWEENRRRSNGRVSSIGKQEWEKVRGSKCN